MEKPATATRAVSARTGTALTLFGAIALVGVMSAAPSAADEFTVCPSGLSGVATDGTSCEFADNVRWAWFSQPGGIVTAYSPVSEQSYTMQCASTSTDFWPKAKRCVGVNAKGTGLIVYIAD